MSTSQKLNYTLESVNAIQQSLENKGAEITSTTPLGEYASIIDNLPSEGDVVESIALGTATDAQVGDKVLLNPAIALQNPVALEYTKIVNSYWRGSNNTRNAPNIGVFSSTKGYAEMLYNTFYSNNGLNVDFTWNAEQNKYIGVNKPASRDWRVVWGTSKQMYYVEVGDYSGNVYGDVGIVAPDLSFDSLGQLDDASEPLAYLAVYKNYFSRGNLRYTYRITDMGIETVSKGSSSAYGFVEYNNVIYTTGNFSSSALNGYSFENTTIQIAGLPSTPNEITCLDSNSNYIIAGPYGTPAQFKIFKQLSTSDATNLRLEEDIDLTAQLPINTEAQTGCNFYVIPIQDGQDFADIFIRYGGRLFYCKWDGTTLTNYGLITDRGQQFSFNPVERILFTNRAIVEDNTSDYQVFYFQGIMNKPFTAMDITSRNWSTQTLTGYVKSNEGQDEFGNTILKVNTVTDPNEEPWSDVGKLYGFNINVEAGHLEESGGVTDITPVLTSNGTLGSTTSWAITANASYGASEPFFMLDGKSDGGSERGRWQVNDSDTENAWIKWSSPTPVKIETILVQNDEARYTVNQYEILGSNDNNDYVSLSSGTNTDRAEGSTWTIAVNSNDFYRYYQLKVTAFFDTSFPAIEIRSLTFYGSNE